MRVGSDICTVGIPVTRREILELESRSRVPESTGIEVPDYDAPSSLSHNCDKYSFKGFEKLVPASGRRLAVGVTSGGAGHFFLGR